jgi:hypothetical protein
MPKKLSKQLKNYPINKKAPDQVKRFIQKFNSLIPPQAHPPIAATLF